MRAVIQRVSEACVFSEGIRAGSISGGLLVFLGVAEGDDLRDAEYLAEKVGRLRIFEDDEGKMNLSVLDAGGSILSVSQFTLLGDCRKGRRPGFSAAEEPGKADRLYGEFNSFLRQMGIDVAEGVFRTDMKVHLVNDGPVTMLLDSKKLF